VRRAARVRAACALLLLSGGACAIGQGETTGDPRYSTVHDTMPEPVHRAKHDAAERPASQRALGHGIRAVDGQMTRIAGTNDAWLDFALVRDADSRAPAVDTITLLMNCNADSISTLEHNGRRVRGAITLATGERTTFGAYGRRVRVYGLRPILPGKAAETLVRTAFGGDMVLETPVDEGVPPG
jgi:hypothetical protein